MHAHLITRVIACTAVARIGLKVDTRFVGLVTIHEVVFTGIGWRVIFDADAVFAVLVRCARGIAQIVRRRFTHAFALITSLSCIARVIACTAMRVMGLDIYAGVSAETLVGIFALGVGFGHVFICARDAENPHGATNQHPHCPCFCPAHRVTSLQRCRHSAGTYARVDSPNITPVHASSS